MTRYNPELFQRIGEMTVAALAQGCLNTDVVGVLKAIIEANLDLPTARLDSPKCYEHDQLLGGGTKVPDGQVLMPKLMTQKEVAPWIKKSEAWLERCRWAKEGIPYLKLNRSVRYKAEDVSEWLERNRYSFTEDSGGLHEAGKESPRRRM